AELHLAGLEALEQQIKRHDLGERGRMAQAVGVLLLERLAAVHIDHDRREGRAVAALAHRVDAMADLLLWLRVLTTVATRVGRVGRNGERADRSDQTENRKAESPRHTLCNAEHRSPLVRCSLERRPPDVPILRD